MFSVNYIAGETVIQQGACNYVNFHLRLMTSITVMYNTYKCCMMMHPDAHAFCFCTLGDEGDNFYVIDIGEMDVREPCY